MRLIACKVQNKNGWYEIALTGKWAGHRAGEFELRSEDLKQIVFNFQNMGLDVVVDYEHQTLFGNEAPAAGWIKHPDGLKIEGDKLLAKIEWTPRAKEMIEKKEYRYLSPTIVPNYTDPVTGNSIGWVLHSVALTNTPFLKELPAISNKNGTAHQEDNKNTNQKEEKMEKEKELQQQLQQKDDQIKALKDKLEALEKELQEHRKVAATAKVKEAIAAKKLSPDQESWAVEYALKDKEGFEEFLKNAKPIIQKPQDNMFAASDKPQGAINFDKV
ncbi:phage protease [Hydrogenimonas thermophila]|uniref:phage protease n=1 Tax=Hydrogenimonas thermophila TaxID=223786 RepID=UPI0029371671|nr:phage protease [Hydrogenimonas thermophila]WOE69096.1 phage protease [Hydrogenimonas thermophila]WOE71606.1 phage protease [Hydrogenimonas thermophila]